MRPEDLLSHLTLGTARRELPDELVAWLEERQATDPTADPGELLLAALALGERQARFTPREGPVGVVAAAPEESRLPPTPLLARGAALIVGGTYPALLPELFELLLAGGYHAPFPELPKLLDGLSKLVREQPEVAYRRLPVLGERGRWLAGLNPEWAHLHPEYDFAVAFGATGSAKERVPLLRQWRQVDPAAAREALSAIWTTLSPRNQELLLETCSVGLSFEDIDFLTEALVPRRAGVRQQAARLLLLAGEAEVLSDFQMLARSALDEDGRWERVIDDPVDQEILQRYGGLPKRTELPAHLLGLLPPYVWRNLQEAGYRDFYGALNENGLIAATRAATDHRDEAAARALVEVLSVRAKHSLSEAELAGLAGVLSEEVFTATFHDLLSREDQLFHPGGTALQLAVLTPHGWSVRITKAAMTQLSQHLFGGGAGYLLRGIEHRWRAAIPRLNPEAFNWLRGQLQAATERPDGLGRLATETLQVTHFRGRLDYH